MRKAGYDYAHPDDVEGDIRRRLATITKSGSIPVDKMTPAQLSALKDLQAYERKVGVTHRALRDELVDPVADRIEEEMFSRKTK
jgi:hypothetical protein